MTQFRGSLPGQKPVESGALEPGFKYHESALKLPLRGGLFTGGEKRLAVQGGVVTAQGLAAAGAGRRGKVIRPGPQAVAGQKIVLHAGARKLLEVAVGEVVVERGANVFMGEIDAAHAFVIRGERDRHVR